MSYDPGNPYASPTSPPPPPGSNPGSLQFMEAFNYIFRSANWLTNVLLSVVCAIIPVVGPIVLTGYQFDLIESLHRSAGQRYPDFDFNRFGYYLSRGVWPFLVGLAATLVLIPVFLILFVLPIFCAGSIIKSTSGAVFAIVFFLAMILWVCLILLFSLLLIPLQMRAGLMQNFGSAFNVTFIKDFVSRVWLEMVLQALFLALAGFVLMLGGLLLCVIGVYPAMMIGFLAQSHLHYQLYEIYLSRGGEPIPLMPPQPM